MKTLFTAFLAGTVFLSTPLLAEAPPKQQPAEKPAEKLTYEGGDGSSLEKAIVIKGAKDSREGIDAEYRWVAKQFPGSKTAGQSLRSKDGKYYDVLEVVTKDGKQVEVFFDITGFFGKF